MAHHGLRSAQQEGAGARERGRLLVGIAGLGGNGSVGRCTPRARMCVPMHQGASPCASVPDPRARRPGGCHLWLITLPGGLELARRWPAARCWRWTLEASGRQQEAVATPSLSESCTVQPQSSSTLARPQRSCLLGILLRLGMGRRAGTRGAAPSVRGRSCGRHLPSPGRKADPPPPNRLKTLDDAKNRGEELSRLLMSIEGRKYSPIFCVELPEY